MSLLSSLGFGSDKKVRYGFVGLGDIAQEAMLPGVSDTGNSVIAALVTGDPEKARALGKRYAVEDLYTYEQFPELLASGKIDAIYLATPNWRHAEFIVPALRAGIHVLTEKPLEITADKAKEILAVHASSSAKLMVAYRLHFEPATLATIQLIREGQLGELIHFSAVFAQMLDPENHRAKNGVLAGPLLDMGPYPINAARYIFGREPLEVVSAVATRHNGTGFMDMDDTVAATLRFPDNKLAQFVVSYAANAVGSFTVVGTKGSVELNPSFTYGEPLVQHVTIGKEKSTKPHKATDQFAGEMRYFSDCIINDRAPEPDGEEGLADLLVTDAILKAIETGGSVSIPQTARTRLIDPTTQLQKVSANRPPEPVNAAKPARQDN